MRRRRRPLTNRELEEQLRAAVGERPCAPCLVDARRRFATVGVVIVGGIVWCCEEHARGVYAVLTGEDDRLREWLDARAG